MTGNLFYKLIVFILFVFLLAFVISLYVRNERLQQVVETMAKLSETQAKTFSQALGRAETKIDATGELIKTLAQTIPEDIRRDLDERNAEIITIATARFGTSSRSSGRASVVLATSERTGPTTISRTQGTLEASSERDCNTGPYKWNFGDWRITGSLIAHCGEPGEFEYQLDQKFELVQVSGDDDSNYVNLYELDATGKRLPKAMLERFNVFKKAPQVAQFYWWAPHLDIAGSVNHEGTLGAEMAVSIMGYGSTTNDLSWRFLRGGVVYSSDLGAVLCPVSYNVGDPLPLLSNVWINPCYQYLDSYGASLSIGAQL